MLAGADCFTSLAEGFLLLSNHRCGKLDALAAPQHDPRAWRRARAGHPDTWEQHTHRGSKPEALFINLILLYHRGRLWAIPQLPSLPQPTFWVKIHNGTVRN